MNKSGNETQSCTEKMPPPHTHTHEDVLSHLIILSDTVLLSQKISVNANERLDKMFTITITINLGQRRTKHLKCHTRISQTYKNNINYYFNYDFTGH